MGGCPWKKKSIVNCTIFSCIYVVFCDVFIFTKFIYITEKELVKHIIYSICTHIVVNLKHIPINLSFSIIKLTEFQFCIFFLCKMPE